MRKEEIIFFGVVGDSMEGCHIFDGDLVIKQCNEVRSGQIAVVMVGDEATIKKVYYKNDLMILRKLPTLNMNLSFLLCRSKEELPVKVIGLVKFVRRDINI